ncbi:MAG TPA: serine/threonine protein kinase [Bacillota bacterium]|nr:serine/threonine protein kinase [Bacillota bacterium]
MWQQVIEAVKKVKVDCVGSSCPVQVTAQPAELRCVGLGTTAAVFQLKERPEIAVKVFLPSHAAVCREEAEIYTQLGVSPYFPAYYGCGENFLIIGFRPGHNVYDYLVQGLHIPEQVILDVEEGLNYARTQGLNPSDIHLKNIIIHNGRGFLVDVSSYRRVKECKRWQAVRHAYYNYYVELYQPGLAVPSWILEAIRKWYKATEDDLEIGSFAERMLKLFF